VVKPIFSISRSRISKYDTKRSSPPKPNSPKTAVLLFNFLFKKEEVIAKATAKSKAGSLVLKPPTIFKIIS
jgi:hypothetical protein